MLPPASGYPGVIAAGDGGGMDWLVVTRKPGVPLARAWPTMSTPQRRSAITQLANRLRQIHLTKVPEGLPPLNPPQLIDAGSLFPLDPLHRALLLARGLPGVPASIVDNVAVRVQQLGSSLDGLGTHTLVHGDLTFENVLWDGERVSAIIDFEWSRGAPPDLDLDVFLRMCALPALHVADDYRDATRSEDYAAIPEWLAEDYPELFAVPRLRDRLELYSLAFDLNELLLYPPRGDVRALPPLHALNRMQSTLAGRGHLARWFGAIAT